MCSEKYAKNHVYLNQMKQKLCDVQLQHQLFTKLSDAKLYLWQDCLLRKVFNQNDRQVTWVWEETGNIRKTWIANYLSILYNFTLLDGTITSRDLAYFFSPSSGGVCIDVSRHSETTFDYSVIENLKDGYLVTGKYEGRTVRFLPVNVVVLANFHPNLSSLSLDRWDIHHIGHGLFNDVSKTYARVPISREFPFKIPAKMPCLHEDFQLKDYLARNGHLSYTGNNHERVGRFKK